MKFGEILDDDMTIIAFEVVKNDRDKILRTISSIGPRSFLNFIRRLQRGKM